MKIWPIFLLMVVCMSFVVAKDISLNNGVIITPLPLRTNDTARMWVNVTLPLPNVTAVRSIWYVNGTNISDTYQYNNNFTKYKNLTDPTNVLRAVIIDAKYMIASDQAGAVFVYNRSNGLFNLKKTLNYTLAGYAYSAYTDHNKYIYLGSSSNHVAVVNRSTLKNLVNLSNQTGAAHAVTATATRVFVGSFDNKIYVYNKSNSFLCTHVLSNATSQVKFVFAYKDLLCSASQDGKLRIYNATTLRMIKQINDSNTTSLLTCHIDDKYIYSGGVAERMWVYNKTTKTLIKTFRITTGNYIRQILSDQRYIYTGGDERKIYVIKYPQLTWYKNISVGQNIVTMEHDNQYLVLGHGTGTYEVTVYDKLLWRTYSTAKNIANLSNSSFQNTSRVAALAIAYARNDSVLEWYNITVWMNGTAAPATPTSTTDAHVEGICQRSYTALAMGVILIFVIIGASMIAILSGGSDNIMGIVIAAGAGTLTLVMVLLTVLSLCSM